MRRKQMDSCEQLRRVQGALINDGCGDRTKAEQCQMQLMRIRQIYAQSSAHVKQRKSGAKTRSPPSSSPFTTRKAKKEEKFGSSTGRKSPGEGLRHSSSTPASLNIAMVSFIEKSFSFLKTT